MVGLSEGQVKTLNMASRLHDLGKLCIPAEILAKPGKLTESEFAMARCHPQIGYDILKPLKLPAQVAEIVVQHHERMNGSGYPRGLSGQDICLPARILGVADVLEAMSSHRPYRPALGWDQALEEIFRHKGILYDALVVEASLKLSPESLEAIQPSWAASPVPQVAAPTISSIKETESAPSKSVPAKEGVIVKKSRFFPGNLRFFSQRIMHPCRAYPLC
jgi:HD-GYP domain-containing protein (c-di-GMP phosphodiesterase class II)